MNYAPLVRILQRIGDLQRDLPGVLERQRAFGRITLDQLHHERPFFNSVYVRDIRVIERSQHLRFALETGQAGRVVGEGGGKDLDGHLAPQLRICRLPDLAHAAFGQVRGDTVMRDGLLRAHRQIWGHGITLRPDHAPLGHWAGIAAPTVLLGEVALWEMRLGPSALPEVRRLPDVPDGRLG